MYVSFFKSKNHSTFVIMSLKLDRFSLFLFRWQSYPAHTLPILQPFFVCLEKSTQHLKLKVFSLVDTANSFFTPTREQGFCFRKKPNLYWSRQIFRFCSSYWEGKIQSYAVHSLFFFLFRLKVRLSKKFVQEFISVVLCLSQSLQAKRLDMYQLGIFLERKNIHDLHKNLNCNRIQRIFSFRTKSFFSILYAGIFMIFRIFVRV